MALGVYGKHPAKGDFVEYGLPPDLRAALESWLDQVLAEGPEQERMEAWIMTEVERGLALPGLYPMNDDTKARYAAWKAAQ